MGAVLAALLVPHIVLAPSSPRLRAPVLLQAPAPVGPNEAIAFDKPDAEFTNEAVTEFRNQYDGGSWVSIGVPTNKVTVSGVTSYKVVPTLTGNHTISFAACNAFGCSAGTSPFAYAYVNSAPTPPTNVRVVPR
jgi:hypothetical protein